MALDPNTNWNNPVSSTPDANVAPQPPQASPQSAQSQAQAAPTANAAPSAAPSAQPTAPQNPVANLHPEDQRAHAIGRTYQAVLQGLSGGPQVSYQTDENGKVQKVVTPTKPGQAWRRIVASALVGLGAGAEAGQTARPGAEALTGLGAGASAAINQAKQEDLLKRKQSAEDFEREQQSTLQRANIAHLNSATMMNYFARIKAGNDMSAEFANNRDLVKELGDAGIGAQVMSSDDAKALLSKDSNTKVGADDNISTHFVLPLGREPIMVNGKQAIDPKTGEPLTQMQVGVVSGMPNGKIPVTPALRSDLDKYLQYSGVPAGATIADGKELEPRQYISLLRAVQAGKAKVAEGEAHPIEGLVDGKMTYINPVTGKPVLDLQNVTPNAENKVAAQGVENKLKGAQTTEANAKANEANASAAKSRADIISDSDLANVADAVYRGDMDLTKVTSMRGNQRAKLAQLIEERHPDFNMQNYNVQLKTMQDFTSGKTSQNITALNTSIAHLDQLSQAADALNNGNIQILNHVANSLGVQIGDSPMSTYSAIHNAVSGEVGKTFKGASPTDPELATMDKTFSPSQSPKQAKAALDATIKLFAGKLDALNNQFRNGTGKNASERGIMLISPESQAVLQRHGFNFGSNGASAVPAGQVQVQIPGQPAAFIPQGNLAAFRQKYPNAVVVQ